MIRDYITYELEKIKPQIDSLRKQEQIIKTAKGKENKLKREKAEQEAQKIREELLTIAPQAGLQVALLPTAIYELFETTKTANAVDFRTAWQQEKSNVECLKRSLQKRLIFTKESLKFRRLTYPCYPPTLFFCSSPLHWLNLIFLMTSKTSTLFITLFVRTRSLGFPM